MCKFNPKLSLETSLSDITQNELYETYSKAAQYAGNSNKKI